MTTDNVARTKHLTVPIKAAGDGLTEGQFTGYAAVFGNKDSYGDVIVKGAFEESLSTYRENGAGIACYWSHQMSDPEMCIGETVEAREDDHGLFVKVQLDLDTVKGAQVYRLIKAGRVNQMSFAYDIEDYAFAHDEEKGEFLELRRLKLHEVSVVQVGANQETELLDVKTRLSQFKAGRAISAKNEEKLREVNRLVDEVLADLDGVEGGEEKVDTPPPKDGGALDSGGEPDTPSAEGVGEKGPDLRSLIASINIDSLRKGNYPMPTLMEKRDEILAAVNTIQAKADEESRDFTKEEAAEVQAKAAEVRELNERIKAAKTAKDLLASLGAPESVEQKSAGTDFGSSFGDYATKSLSDTLAHIKGRRKVAGDAAEYPRVKAAGDTHTVTTTGEGVLQPEIDKNIVSLNVERPTIASWLGSGQLTATAITYFVEQAYDASAHGKFEYVAENAKKPGLTFPPYTPVTESLKKIAGWIKISDEMAEDTPFLVSEINNRLLYQLVMMEEAELLNGAGGGSIAGLLGRSGVQVETAASEADNLDALYRALTKVQLATGLSADGVVMHPLDYQKLRLAKDGNGQYLAGGPFLGQYGNGGVTLQPPVWGQTPIVTTAIPEGTALVGAGKQAATVYRKGGIRVEASNIDGEDFTHNRFTVLAEERLTLAVRQPSAFVKVSLASGAGAAA
ncbi:HK97 family phage prohead protease [Dermabacter hominis]|uniref:HK97 family phage prohead protease n=1 Tax=Dermabacter hominis TaxID=36740 RepID=UPI0021A6D4CA|nr:HK97 family phage prohead protease [Dermabacter hominis]MCT1956378.1 HK97 family phage prohead protease [Dermabacter hominis]